MFDLLSFKFLYPNKCVKEKNVNSNFEKKNLPRKEKFCLRKSK